MPDLKTELAAYRKAQAEAIKARSRLEEVVRQLFPLDCVVKNRRGINSHAVVEGHTYGGATLILVTVNDCTGLHPTYYDVRELISVDNPADWPEWIRAKKEPAHA